MFMSGLRAVALLLIGLSTAAQAELPALALFQASAPVRLAHGYHFQVEMRLHNPGAEALAPMRLQFRFRTLSDVSLVCRFVDQPSQAEILALPALAPTEEFALSRLLLLPATWYRGAGQLEAWFSHCAESDCTVPDEWQRAPESADLVLY
jgi:hypothetical protein